MLAHRTIGVMRVRSVGIIASGGLRLPARSPRLRVARALCCRDPGPAFQSARPRRHSAVAPAAAIFHRRGPAWLPGRSRVRATPELSAKRLRVAVAPVRQIVLDEISRHAGAEFRAHRIGKNVLAWSHVKTP
jgi:hypothetical protein